MIAQIIHFLQAHQVVEASIAMAILDALFALNPNAKANSFLHWVYDKLVGLKG